MKNNESYFNLLRYLLCVESIGGNFYKVVAAKEKNQALSSVYVALATAEDETGERIAQELRNLSGNHHIPLKNIGVVIINAICHILPLWLLKNVLKYVLNKKIYSRLSVKYKALNPGFWETLVKHERLQCELFSTLFESATIGGMYYE